MIPDDKISEIRSRVDIVELIGEYVTLKRSGVSFKGLCPFHNEKSPSFYVHPKRRFFHCFGCAASGDVFSFLTRLEGASFPEVARRLAERAGVDLPRDNPREEAAYRRKKQRDERLTSVMDAAAGFYLAQLKSHPLGGMARDELASRGISMETAETFRLGYAPHGWGELTSHLAKVGHSPSDSESVGLILSKRTGRGHYDRFRHRLQFPIADLHGRIVAFSGRLLANPEGVTPPKEPGAKYVNSPEGPLYTKGKVLFGLHEARVAIRRIGYALMCEGNFDLLALHQAGFENVVAPLGTAFTEEHAKLLKRFTEKLVLLFDGDAAGKKAVRAAHPLLARVGIAARVVTLPPGDDPDTFLRSHGAEALTRRVQEAPGIVEHLIDDTARSAGGDARAKADGIASLGEVLVAVDNPVEVRLYVERVAQRFGIADVQVVRQQLRRGLKKKRDPRSKKRGNIPEQKENPQPKRAPRREPPGLQAELVGVLLDVPRLFSSDYAKGLLELLTDDDLRAIFFTSAKMVEADGNVDGPALLKELEGSGLTAWLEERLAVQKYEESTAESALVDGVPRLKKMHVEQMLRTLAVEIEEAFRLGNVERGRDLAQKRDALRRGALSK